MRAWTGRDKANNTNSSEDRRELGAARTVDGGNLWVNPRSILTIPPIPAPRLHLIH